MALKIIKSGTARAAGIQKIRFSENSGKSAPASEQGGQPETVTMPGLVSEIAETIPEPASPVPDPAILEQTAYQNGYLQGENAGIQKAEFRVEEAMRRYGESILELSKLRSSLFAQVEREVVRLSLEVAKKIVHREIQADRDIIQTLVRVALSHAAEKSAVTVHLNATDYNYILTQRTELAQSEGRDISLLADKSIERGGCLIQTECGEIDARIEEKFREVERAFFEGVK